MFIKKRLAFCDRTVSFWAVRKIGSVISSTLGVQYVKNSSTSSTGCPGVAVIDLKPKKVMQYPKVNEGIPVNANFFQLKSAGWFMI